MQPSVMCSEFFLLVINKIYGCLFLKKRRAVIMGLDVPKTLSYQIDVSRGTIIDTIIWRASKNR